MLTFVINLHTGIPSMALAEPFLYPLQKNETLHLIFSTTDSVARRLEDAAMKVRQHLERSAYFKWQVVFLVKIAPDQAGAFQDSLSAQMSLIKQLFLQSPHLNLRPHNNFIIALDHLNGLPGALVRWFLLTIGPAGICALVPPGAPRGATARTAVARCDGERVDVFVGETRGVVVPKPRGEHGFGWDPVFQPDGSGRTFAEMEPGEKLRFGMRRKALDALRGWLETNPESG